MTRRQVWLPTYLQPVGALVVIGTGWAAHERYPAGGPEELTLLMAIAAVTLPGVTVAVIDAVRHARLVGTAGAPGPVRPSPTPASGAELSDARPPVPARSRSVASAVGWRILGWSAVQALLGCGLAVILLLLPIGADWAQLALAPVILAVALVTLTLLSAIAWLAVKVLASTIRPDRD